MPLRWKKTLRTQWTSHHVRAWERCHARELRCQSLVMWPCSLTAWSITLDLSSMVFGQMESCNIQTPRWWMKTGNLRGLVSWVMTHDIHCVMHSLSSNRLSLSNRGAYKPTFPYYLRVLTRFPVNSRGRSRGRYHCHATKGLGQW